MIQPHIIAGTLVDSTVAVEAMLAQWAIANGHEPEQLTQAHGTRMKDLVKRWQIVPVPGVVMNDQELEHEVSKLEMGITRNAENLTEQGEKGVYELPGVNRMIEQLVKGGAR